MKRALGAALTALTLSACASMIEGTSQEIAVTTDPAGANCVLDREEAAIARIDPTPGAATVAKSHSDITVVCSKDGYRRAEVVDHRHMSRRSVLGSALTGGIGAIIDEASGAMNRYDSPIHISLAPVPGAASAPPAPGDNAAQGSPPGAPAE